MSACHPIPVLRHVATAAVSAVLAPAIALAAEPPAAPMTGATPASACLSIESDADRLKCYDEAMGRGRVTSTAADLAAAEARLTKQRIAEYDRAEREAASRRDDSRRMLSELFRSEHDSIFDQRIANAGKGSILDSRWELAKDSKLGLFNLRGYKPVYLFPVFWTSHPNTLPSSSRSGEQTSGEPLPLDDTEAKFQLSFKTKVAENLFGDNGDLWTAYTQSSRWQVYNGEESRPFRETNYEPEVMLVFRNNYSLLGWRGRMLAVGFNHQSNGRADPISRSWNRVMLNVGLDRDDWALTVRPWWRIPDGEREDENPGIEDYVGRADATLVRRWNGHEFALMARHSLRSGEDAHGAMQFDWGFPISRSFRGHLQVFDGYGESLIDYNHRATYVGLGISLLEWY
ncbi:phospholipase [Lysobacter daejeonensis GH1-9]|uniref:Phospholipase A1 n=2 Tax=Aerolutibacter TaxID=3382701 RepID=A0A0A0EY70_9GAMM|nr:phospholipase A [Lysobacter daejeonensis]KGM55871.1 phospholipase [Lysobacter daejeonensis GH1-9]